MSGGFARWSHSLCIVLVYRQTQLSWWPLVSWQHRSNFTHIPPNNIYKYIIRISDRAVKNCNQLALKSKWFQPNWFHSLISKWFQISKWNLVKIAIFCDCNHFEIIFLEIIDCNQFNCNQFDCNQIFVEIMWFQWIALKSQLKWKFYEIIYTWNLESSSWFDWNCWIWLITQGDKMKIFFCGSTFWSQFRCMR